MANRQIANSRQEIPPRSCLYLPFAYLLFAIFPASCSNPLAPIDADYDRHLAAAPERLRSGGGFDSQKFAQPAFDPNAKQDLSAKPPSRLEGLANLPLTIE